MKALGAVQFLSWGGLFCVWMFFVPAIARRIFLAPTPRSPQYDAALEWGGVCLAFYSIASVVVAPALPAIARRLGRPLTHALALACAGISLLSMLWVSSPYALLLVMAGVGVAWASMHSMPYAIVADAVPPERMGVYMGVFSVFIATPGIVVSLALRPFMRAVLGSDPFEVLMLGGAMLLVSSVLALRIPAANIDAPSYLDHGRNGHRRSALAGAPRGVRDARAGARSI
jgi:maltose/moltooligosaccharide transporter